MSTREQAAVRAAAEDEAGIPELEQGFAEALASRSPFVVRGAASTWPVMGWTEAELQAAIGAVDAGQYWHNVPRGACTAADIPCPDWLTAYWRRRAEHLSLERPMRFWQAAGGHQTPWHYDGNALDVINVQLTGAKRFTLAPPDRELPWIRFLPVSALGCGDAQVPNREVILGPGDLLYLPRFWSHRVQALEPVNRNLNWVWTDASFEPDSAVAVREAERLAAVRKLEGSGELDGRLEAFEAETLRQEARCFAGSQHHALVARMLDTVAPGRVDARIHIELQALPAADFIAALQGRARKLFVREMFSPAVSAGLLSAEG